MPHAQGVSKEQWPSQVAGAAGNPALTLHWIALRKSVVCSYRNVWGSGEECRLLGLLLYFLLLSLFPYTSPCLTDNAKHNLFSFFWESETLQHLPVRCPGHMAQVF